VRGGEMDSKASLKLNQECYCWPVERQLIIDKIIDQDSAPNMTDMLSERPHYFANTGIFLSQNILNSMTDQIQAIEAVIKLPRYIEYVMSRSGISQKSLIGNTTKGVFMGYDFHIANDGPKLIEINTNAGGAFIVNMIEQAVQSSTVEFAQKTIDMFQSEWMTSGRKGSFKTIAIVDTKPTKQYHYPDMCLAKSLLEAQGVKVVITDPVDLSIIDNALFHKNLKIDMVYNRLTDFGLSEPANKVIRRAYEENTAVVTPAPHHHVLHADKRNLIVLSDQNHLAALEATPVQLKALKAIPITKAVTDETATDMWETRKSLFFKPQAGFGSRGAFRGTKLTKKVWRDILRGGYIAQDRVSPPLRAVTVGDEKTTLKFDVRVYTYDGNPLLLATRIYQGQTTNLRTSGGGLAAVRAI